MANILLIRFSAFGDVAMMVPIVHSLATQYPQHDITVLSRTQFAPLFATMPPNVHFRGVNWAKDYAGINGLNTLYRELKAQEFDCVADFHSVLRTIYLRFRFYLSGHKIASIRKGHKEKKKLTRMGYKKLKPLKTSFQRYSDVLKRLGFPIKTQFTSIFGEKKGVLHENTLKLTGTKENEKWVGIAPFATYKGKIYPLDKMQRVIETLSNKKRCKIFLFGGGEPEVMQLKSWSQQFDDVVSVAGVLPLEQELALISHLDVMISMDSANMHLASLVNTPVISIWGATHPYAGFLGWNQSDANTIQKELPCRPCSVFGNKPCRFENYDCLQIQPQSIIKKIESFL